MQEVKILWKITYTQMWWKIIDGYMLWYLNDMFEIKLIFLRFQLYIATFQFGLMLRYSAEVVFNNFLLIYIFLYLITHVLHLSKGRIKFYLIVHFCYGRRKRWYCAHQYFTCQPPINQLSKTLSKDFNFN